MNSMIFFQFVVKLEFILMCDKVYKIVYLTLINDSYTFDEYMDFYPLSLYNQAYVDYPFVQKLLKDLSLIDVIYMVAMVIGLHQYFSVTQKKSIILLCICYVSPLILVNYFLLVVGL